MMLTKSYLIIQFLFLALFTGCVPEDQAGRAHTSNVEIIQPDLDGIKFYQRPDTLKKIQQRDDWPQIVFRTTEPWNMVVGSDSPKFALYANGKVIYNDQDSFKTVTLSKVEQANLLKAVSGKNISKFNGYYEASEWTDQPTNTLLNYANEPPTIISVYGALDKPETIGKLPEWVNQQLSKIASFEHVDAKQWLPEFVEVMITPYEYAPDKSVVWPSHWPGIEGAKTKQRGDSFSLYLNKENLDELKSFLKTRKSRGAIEIDGKKWSASYRFPFPHEELWMAPRTN